MAKYVYIFGNGKADGNGSMKALLGGKGANLAEMSRIGLPVPPGFTVTTEVCTYYYANKRTYPKALDAQTEGRRCEHRKDHGHEVRRQEKHAAARVRSFRRAGFHAGHDGHDSESRIERRHGAVACRGHEERTLCLGLLSPLHSDVWRRGDGRSEDSR